MDERSKQLLSELETEIYRVRRELEDAEQKESSCISNFDYMKHFSEARCSKARDLRQKELELLKRQTNLIILYETHRLK